MIRRLVHYLLLAAVLVGLPLGCAWIAGYDAVLADVAALPPRCEEWLREPTRLWAVKCPFSWWLFAAMGVVVAAAVLPFARRAWRSFANAAAGEQRRYGFPLWGWVGVAVMAVGWVIAWNRFDCCKPIQRYPYVAQWAGFIVLVNALCVKRTGRSPLTDNPRRFLLLFPTSSLFWWFFEYLNRYVWNWFYVGVPGIGPVEYVIFATLCFASVLPGVVSVAALLGSFRAFADETYAGLWRVDVRSRASQAVLASGSLVGLVGIVFLPQFAYPFLWISPLMVFVLLQVRMGERCVLDALADGSWGVVVRYAAAALVCGLVWETWNYYSLAKWIYNVPWVSRFHVWEMPLLGFAGYLPFGLECAAIADWVSRSRR